MSAAPASTPHLIRQLGFWSAVAVTIGSTIGSGIFRSPAGIAEKLPGPLPMLAVWVVAGIFVLCGALTMAELGGAFPYAGGLYVFLREAYGRPIAFLFGWAQLVLIRPAANGAVALVFGEYALRVLGWKPNDSLYPNFDRASTYLAIGAMVIVSAVNYRGVKWGAWLQNATTLAKTGGLVVLIVLAFAIGLPRSGGHFTPASPPGSFSFSMFGLALVGVLWAYDGWADLSYVGGEVVNPRRNVPRAILTGTLIIIAVYLAANFAYLSVFSVGEIAGSKQVAADTMLSLMGSAGVVFIVATVMISTFGTLNGSLMTAPRIYFALAEDRLFFKPVAKVHPRFHTPYVATVLTMLLAILFIVVGKIQSDKDAFTQLTDAFVIALVPFYGLSVASVFIFRAREGRRGRGNELRMSSDESSGEIQNPQSKIQNGEDRPPYDPSVRTPLYPVVPIVFILSTIMLLANAVMDESSRIATLITLGVVLVGLPVYFLTVGRRQ